MGVIEVFEFGRVFVGRYRGVEVGLEVRVVFFVLWRFFSFFVF